MSDLRLPHEPEPRYARATPDGFVIFSPEAIDLVLSGKISHADATALWVELSRASFAAERADKAARGFDEWISHPVGGGQYEVTHGGETCRFRPIVNSQRRLGGPGVRIRNGHRCSACSGEAPQGATMYVPAGDDPRRTQGLWGGRRLCSTCVRPELAAAVIGAALAGAGGTS